MPSRKAVVPGSVPVEVLREAARQRVLNTSLRVAAAEIALSHRGLEGFIKGARPHPQTIRKLTEWHLKRAAAGETSISAAVVREALAILVQHLPVQRRESVTNQVLGLLRTETESAGGPLPPWLESD